MLETILLNTVNTVAQERLPPVSTCTNVDAFAPPLVPGFPSS